MITWKSTIRDCKADVRRRLLLEEKPQTSRAAFMALFNRGVITVLIYRLSRFCFYHHLKPVCKLLALFQQLLDTSEISPEAQIGGGFVVGGLGGVGIPNTAVVGKNCTFMGLNTLTLGAMEEVPGPDDKIVVGDHCVFGTFTRVIRPVSLANGVQVKPCSVVIMTVKKEGQTVSGVPAKVRIKQHNDYQDVQHWNPLKGRPLINTA